MIKGKKILIVEDEPDLLNLYRMLLEKEEAAVLAVSDGEMALEVLRNEEYYDLVLLDIMLPKVDGIQILHTITEQPNIYKQPLSTVMMLTNLAQDQVVSEAVMMGVRGFLVKSDYNPEEFLEAVGEALTN